MDKDELIKQLRYEVQELTKTVAHLQKVANAPSELAQYKEWHEAMQRQLAKRYAQIRELTKQIKDAEKILELTAAYFKV